MCVRERERKLIASESLNKDQENSLFKSVREKLEAIRGQEEKFQKF